MDTPSGTAVARTKITGADLRSRRSETAAFNEIVTYSGWPNDASWKARLRWLASGWRGARTSERDEAIGRLVVGAYNVE
jgi:hypothetical protein